ncbi:hypothetical protein PTW37_06575 [Arthrobacter agilis]|uniref:hypothetical protein n=1 Tax=Arthrobacter agilis TaxID=37921 RepID=UPI00236664E8|nr:hypothetical protein [Arthrobacter agilis]WDF34559.1 hypothetical protein PTW37_06575 [Arthrobacter agilis]
MTVSPTIPTGRVTGRFLIGVADGPDADELPDLVPAQGTITFTASVPYVPTPGAEPVTVLKTQIRAILDADGYLSTPTKADPAAVAYRGIRLFATDVTTASVKNWTWTVSYQFRNPDGTSFGSVVPSHPLALPAGAVIDLTTAVKVPASDAIGVPQVEAMAAVAQQAALDAAADADAARVAAQNISAPPLVTQSVAGLMRASDKTKLDAASSEATPNTIPMRNGSGRFSVGAPVLPENATTKTYVDDEVAKKAPLVHGHTASGIVDFVEAAQDAVALMMAAGTGVTLNYNDAGNALTISSTVGQALDAEAVRDAIGVALIGAGLISVTVNDAADTITITTTATANSTDAFLRSRGNHTGTQDQSTVDGLETALANRAIRPRTPFVVRWISNAWEYASLSAAVTAGLDVAQLIMFVGHPDGAFPAWARESDVGTVG